VSASAPRTKRPGSIGCACRRPAASDSSVTELRHSPPPSVVGIDLAIYEEPMTESGRIELLPFLEEQAISITTHRFGTPDHLTDRLL